MRFARFLILALFLSLLPDRALAAIPLQRLTTTIEVPSGMRSVATNGGAIAIVGEGIHLLSRDADSFDEARSIESDARLFTRVIAARDGFIAVGIAESSVATSTDLPSDLINPDSIPFDTQVVSSLGLTRLVLTQFSIDGTSMKESIYDLDRPFFPSALVESKDRITIVGSIVTDKGIQGFLADVGGQDGSFSLHTFGSIDTRINAIATPRILYGSSGERLVGSNLRGVRDGVIFYLDGNRKLTRVVRSSQGSAKREWSSVNPSHLAVGSVSVGKTREVAVTRFTAAGEPTWFFRVPGSDPHLSGSTIALITTTKINGITGFSPRTSTALFITVDTKKKGAFRKASLILARSIKDLTVGIALIVDRDGRSQLVPFTP